MDTPEERARLLGASLSSLLNSAHHVLRESTPSAEVLHALSDAADQALGVYRGAPGLQGPSTVDIAAVFAIVKQLREALPDPEPERLATLCRELFAALDIQIPTSPTA